MSIVTVAIVILLLVLQYFQLHAMGQPTICTCGYVRIWYGGIATSENSQHLIDWWTYTHVMHGIVLYLLLWLLVPRMPVWGRLLVAVGLEVGWEIFENTPLIINRYRQGALALGYSGDSIVNSLADTVAAISGFGIAAVAPSRALAVGVVLAELLSAYLIRDNLVLNIVQLIHPTEVVSRWQSGK
jgi:hypothetical protein